MIIDIPIILEFPKDFKVIEATPGTAAHPYLGGMDIEQILHDPAFVGGIQQHDGVLLVFCDGSSLFSQNPAKVM